MARHSPTPPYYTVGDPIDCSGGLSILIKARNKKARDPQRRAQGLTDRIYALWLQKGTWQGFDSKAIEEELRNFAKLNGKTIEPGKGILLDEINTAPDKMGTERGRLEKAVARATNTDFGMQFNMDIRNKIVDAIDKDIFELKPLRPIPINR